MCRLALFLVVTIALAQTPPTFNKTRSLRYLYYSYAAYDTPQPGTWNCKCCIGGTAGFVVQAACDNRTRNSFAFVGHNTNNQEIIVSFRGSSNLINWLTDLNAIKTPPGEVFPGLPGAQVHDGFWTYWQSLKSCILPAVNTLRSRYPSYTIGVTGHSLGGAGAAMGAMDMRVNLGYGTLTVLTFGEPRLGNKAFHDGALQYIPGLQRMVNAGDCVVKLPPPALQYVHEAWEIFENPSGADNYKVCNSSGEDPSCGASISQNCDDHSKYMGVTCRNFDFDLENVKVYTDN